VKVWESPRDNGQPRELGESDNLMHSVLGMNKLYDGHEIFVANIM